MSKLYTPPVAQPISFSLESGLLVNSRLTSDGTENVEISTDHKDTFDGTFQSNRQGWNCADWTADGE